MERKSEADTRVEMVKFTRMERSYQYKKLALLVEGGGGIQEWG